MNASEESLGTVETEASARRWRTLRILVGIATAIVLSPVAGMVLVFAIMPALPIVLAIGLVLGPVNWMEDREREADARWGHLPWTEAHTRELELTGRLAHA